MTDANFHDVEKDDWFERNRGTPDYYKVVEIKETFGDRVSLILETRSVTTSNDNDTTTIRVDEPEFEREFTPITDPREGDK